MRRSIAVLAIAAAASAALAAGKGPDGKPDCGGPRVMKPGLVAHYFKDPKEWDGHWLDVPGALPDVEPKDWTFREYRYSRREPLVHHLFIRRGWFSVRWVGYVKVPPAVTPKGGKGEADSEEREVTFEVWMDDGARFFLDGKKLVDDWRPCAEDTPGSHRPVNVRLASGYHRVVIEYFQGQSLRKNDHDPAKLYWSSEALGIKRQIVPASHLFHTDADELDYVPSQGLSQGDLERLIEGELPEQKGPPAGDKPGKEDAGEY